ncbi:MAG: Ig-like domain-containing protein [Pseudobdellovibrio sp.]
MSCLTATDLSDNVTTATYNLNIIGDSVLPTLSANLNEQYIFKNFPQTLQIQITSDEALKSLIVDGQLISSENLTYIYTKNLTQSGVNQISVVATDLFNNVTSQSFSFVVVEDNKAPEITLGQLDVSPDQTTIKLPVSVVDDSSVATEVFLNQVLVETRTEKSFIQEISIPQDGSYVISVRAIDAVGQFSVKTVNFIRDTSPLSINVAFLFHASAMAL